MRYPQIWDKKVKISGETVAWIPKSLQHYNIPKIYYLDTLIYEYIELFGTQGGGEPSEIHVSKDLR